MNSVILEQSRGTLFCQVPICECDGSEQSNKSSCFLSGRDVPVDFDRLTNYSELLFCTFGVLFLFVSWFCSNNLNYF